MLRAIKFTYMKLLVYFGIKECIILKKRMNHTYKYTVPGDVPRVDGQLAVARAFGDGSLKKHLSSEPHVVDENVDDDTELLILASDGLWKVTNSTKMIRSDFNYKV